MRSPRRHHFARRRLRLGLDRQADVPIRAGLGVVRVVGVFEVGVEVRRHRRRIDEPTCPVRQVHGFEGRPTSVLRMRAYDDLTELGRARRLRRLLEVALREYPFEVLRIRLLTNETNGVFRVDTRDGEKLVARVGLGGQIGHGPQQVAAEVAFLEHLAGYEDLTVATVVRATDGRGFVTVEADGVPGPRNVVVFAWLPGRVLGDQKSSITVAAMGELSARLHRAAVGFVPPRQEALPRHDRAFPFREDVVVFDDSLVSPQQLVTFRGAQTVIEAALAELGAAGFQIVHGDLHPWNVMVSRSGLAAFDFEDLMVAHPVQDVATSLYYFYVDDGWEAHREEFRAGYEHVSPWPESKPGLLETFIAGRALVLANDILIVPEWRPLAGEYLPKFASRIEALIG